VTAAAPDITAEISSAWVPPEPLTPSQWAERYRVLGDRVTSEPGPYRGARTPYAAGVLDALGGHYTEVYLQSAAQVCKSEIGRNLIGWSVDQDPGPIMIVFPTEQAARDNIDERIKPMFEDSPKLREHLTGRSWDVKTDRIVLDTCTINIGWAGSPQSTASRPERRVYLDEVNKFPAYRGGDEGSAIPRARKRTQSYGPRGQIYVASTPTVPRGAITMGVESCVDRRTWQVPCPGCGAYSALDWERVEWSGKDSTDDTELLEQLAEIEAGVLEAVHVCECGRAMRDSERWAAVLAGEWVSDGCARGERPVSRTVGFKLSGLCSPWTSFTQLAHRFITAKKKGIGDIHVFYNEDLGVPFWGSISEDDKTRLTDVSAEVLHVKSSEPRAPGYPVGIVPDWALFLVGSADPGKSGAHYTIRAWGRGYRSRLLAAGHVESLEELRRAVLWREFGAGGRKARVSLFVMDSGGGRGTQSKSRTDEIYRFAKSCGPVASLLKGFGGAGTASMPALTRSHQYHPPGESSTPYDVSLTTIDTEYFKDLAAARIGDANPSLWEIGCAVPDGYVLQVASERKSLVERRVKPTGEVFEVFRWAPKIVGAANHYWDCEVYQCVAAFMLDMDRRPPGQEAAPAVAQEDEDEPGTRRRIRTRY
jgi:phage terminase large subunit GpA-like protein